MKGLAYERYLAPALLALAGSVLLVAYLVVCVRTGSFWPWSLVVHEDGQRTLTGTILYFEHATRELPLDILLGMAIGGGVLFAYPPDRGAQGAPRWRVLALALATASVVAAILVGAALRGGLPVVLDNLLQMHTRPGMPLAWGAHWRYHLGSRLALILVSIGFAGLLRCLTDRGHAQGARSGLVVAGAAVGVYLVLTLVFAKSWSSVLLVFQHPIPLGHQARELLTHALVTLPIGWAGGLLMVRHAVINASGGHLETPSRRSSVTAAVAAALTAGAVGALLGSYICVAALMADAAAHGQTNDLAMLVFPHFFEHSFTYLVVFLVAALLYEGLGRATSPSRARAGVRWRGAKG